MSKQRRRRSGSRRRRDRANRTAPTNDRAARPGHAPKPEAPSDALSPWQADVVRDLSAAADRHPELTVESDPVVHDGVCHLAIGLETRQLQRSLRGVRLHDLESFVISVPDTSHRPPHVSVAHNRFLGVPHVMSGYELCLYLDPAREWDAGEGIGGLLSRLWKWLGDAAANQFNPDTALYHAVGGTLHANADSPTFVVRSLPPLGARPLTMYLHRRTRHDDDSRTPRFDLLGERLAVHDAEVPVVRLRRDLPIGAGQHHLNDLLARIQATQGLQPADPHGASRRRAPTFTRALHPRDVRNAAAMVVGAGPVLSAPTGTWFAAAGPAISPVVSCDEPAVQLVRAVMAAAAHNVAGSEQHVVVAVPHPTGGPDHLIGFSVPAQIADALRAAAADGGDLDPMQVVLASAQVPMRWAHLSDERVVVTTRRDIGRPVTVLQGKTVYLWGVGGLGSWIAELVVRAGARRVILCDPGTVTGGLLVRQNFTDADIGLDKATAVASRLRDIRDDVEVQVEDYSNNWAQRILEADLVIDATVSRTVTGVLDSLAAVEGRRATIAQVATDVATGTLGIAIVSCPNSGLTLTDLDRDACDQVRRNPTLEEYSTFWSDPLPGTEFVPTRGCSIPTFHGSAADLAGVASSLLNLVCLHLSSDHSGVELCALPHSMVSPSRKLLNPSPRLEAVA